MFFLHVCLCIMYLVPKEVRRWVGCPGTGVIRDCELPCKSPTMLELHMSPKNGEMDVGL